jgi:hypothetical protein
VIRMVKQIGVFIILLSLLVIGCQNADKGNNKVNELCGFLKSINEKSRRLAACLSACFFLFRKPSFIHDTQFSIDLRPVPNGSSPFFVASKVAGYSAFSRAVSLGNTLLWRIQFPIGGIQRFYRICRVNNLPDSR